MLYMGVDLKTSKKQESSLSIIGDDSSIVFMGTFSDNQHLADIADKYCPQFIAIGSPLTLPAGLCCLESACECQMDSPGKKGRQAELELARMGISCFFTNKRSIITKLVYRANSLNQHLTGMGHRLIEVYPHASKVLLFGDKVPSKKNTKESLQFMKDRLPKIVGGLDGLLVKLEPSSCDALINAHTALLHARDETDLVGCASEGFIALPKLLRIEAIR